MHGNLSRAIGCQVKFVRDTCQFFATKAQLKINAKKASTVATLLIYIQSRCVCASHLLVALGSCCLLCEVYGSDGLACREMLKIADMMYKAQANQQVLPLACQQSTRHTGTLHSVQYQCHQ